MPIVLKKIYKIVGDFTKEEVEILKSLIDEFRLRMADDNPELNILNKKALKYTDDNIVKLVMSTLNDINGGFPSTNYSLSYVYNSIDNSLLLEGAMVFALLREGILQVNNQIDFNDSGLSIGMFNKTQIYQSWYGTLLQQYLQDKTEVKRAAIPNSATAGFYGIDTEFGYRYHYY